LAFFIVGWKQSYMVPFLQQGKKDSHNGKKEGEYIKDA